jgi:hypothetical protein
VSQGEDQQNVEARERDERAAKLSGDYISREQQLHTDDEQALLWHAIIAFLERVSTSGPEDLASTARALIVRVHVL